MEYIFLTTFYDLYFNHQIHITLNSFFKFLHVSWWPSVSSFHVLHLHLSFWLVGTTKLYSLQTLLLAFVLVYKNMKQWAVVCQDLEHNVRDLSTELVWYSNGWKEVDAKWSGFGMPFEYRRAQPFEYRINWRHLVFLCTGLVFKWLVYYIGHSLRQII